MEGWPGTPVRRAVPFWRQRRLQPPDFMIDPNIASTPYNRAHHRLAMLAAGCVFLLIVAGALVTSNDAGLSVPDWPTSFG